MKETAPVGTATRSTAEEWHRTEIGGMWEEVGALQFGFVAAEGLRSTDRFLDVGCGSLRGGVRFIAFLDEGCYHGVDKSEELLRAGRELEVPRAGLVEKRPVLVRMEDFGFERLGGVFDVGMAQSVFTHLPLNDIVRCLMNVDKVLAPGGRFYATFFENEAGKRNLAPIEQPVASGHPVTTFMDRDPYHYDVGTF